MLRPAMSQMIKKGESNYAFVIEVAKRAVYKRQAFMLLLLFTDIFQGIIGFFRNYILDFFYLITDFLPRMFL